MTSEDLLDSPKAWRAAIASSVIIAVSFGTVYAFGAFFDAMATEFDAGRGSTAIVFAVTAFLFFGTGAASGFLADKWGPRPLVLIGGSLFVVGLYTTSLATELWHGYLSYGLGVGFGAGLFIAPIFAMAAGWFERHRGIAQGLIATGSGIGTLVLTPMSERLIDTQGWRQAFVVLALIAAVVFTLTSFFIARPPVEPPAKATQRLRAVLSTTAFRRFSLATALQSGTMLAAFAFTVSFATDEGVSGQTAALLVGIIGGASIGGRLLLTGIVQRTGPVRMLQYSFFVQPFAFAIWALAGGNELLLLVFVVSLGFAYGGFVGLLGLAAAHLFGVRGLGAVMGWLFLASGVGSLIAPPVVGFVADTTASQTIAKLLVVVLSAAGALIVWRLQRDPVDVPTGSPRLIGDG